MSRSVLIFLSLACFALPARPEAQTKPLTPAQPANKPAPGSSPPAKPAPRTNQPATQKPPPAPGQTGKPGRLIIKEFDESALFTDEELAAARIRLQRRQLGTELFYAFMFHQKERVNTLLGQMRKVAPKSEDYQYYSALREYRAGQRGRAMNFLKAAVKINPRYDPAWNLMGLIFTQADRYKDARDAFEKAVEAAPYEPAYTYNLATAMARQGHPREALEQTERSIQLKGNFSDAYHLQAKVLRDLGQYDTALTSFEKANFYGVNTPDFLLDWLRVAHKAGADKKALQLCARIGGERSEVLRIHADIRLKHAEFKRAIPILRTLTTRKDVKPQDRRRYIYALHKAGYNPNVGLRTLRISAKERTSLLAYIKELRLQKKDAPVVRDPILSPPR